GNLDTVDVHHIAVDDPPAGVGAGLDNVAIDAVERAHLAVGMPAAQHLAPALAEIPNLLMLLPARRAGEPFRLGLLAGESLEHALRRMIPMAGDGEAGMGDGARHQLWSFGLV